MARGKPLAVLRTNQQDRQRQDAVKRKEPAEPEQQGRTNHPPSRTQSGLYQGQETKGHDMSTAISTHRETPMNELAANGDQAVKTGMLPDHIKTGWQFAVIAATGHELGMQPMRAIRSLAMVKGKVVESADSQLARFKASTPSRSPLRMQSGLACPPTATTASFQRQCLGAGPSRQG